MARTAQQSKSLRQSLLADLILTVWSEHKSKSVAERADLVATATEQSPLFRTYILNSGVNAPGFEAPANTERFDPPKKEKAAPAPTTEEQELAPVGEGPSNTEVAYIDEDGSAS